MPLPEQLENTEIAGLTVWKVTGGYQANLSHDGQSWRVAHGPTPRAAIAALFGEPSVPVVPALTPPPY